MKYLLVILFFLIGCETSGVGDFDKDEVGLFLAGMHQCYLDENKDDFIDYFTDEDNKEFASILYEVSILSNRVKNYVDAKLGDGAYLASLHDNGWGLGYVVYPSISLEQWMADIEIDGDRIFIPMVNLEWGEKDILTLKLLGDGESGFLIKFEDPYNNDYQMALRSGVNAYKKYHQRMSLFERKLITKDELDNDSVQVIYLEAMNSF